MFLAALISSITNSLSGDGGEWQSFNNFSPFLTIPPKLAQPTSNFSRYNLSVGLSLDLIIQSAEILGYDIGIFIFFSAPLIGFVIVVIKRKVKKLK